MSKPNDQVLGASGQGPAAQAHAGAAGHAPAVPPTRAGTGATAAPGSTATAGTTAPIVGAAGTVAAASPNAGASGAPAPATASSAGQAGAAMAGAGGAQAGAGGASGSAGAAAAAGAGGSSAGDPCPLPFEPYVGGGVPVNGAGCKQQWEGIVMTVGGRGLCSAAFITDRHLISASHCYANDGAVSLQVSAPTWDKGMKHTFQAQVKRSGSNMELDISIIDLGKPVDWATPERRFLVNAGKAASAIDLHLYGFGDSSSSGGAGTLRGVPKRATIHVTETAGGGTLSGKAGDAKLCEGDSGGPALAEKTAAVLYGVNQAIDPAAGSFGTGPCASADWTIVFTNVSSYMSFIEKALGKMCDRKQVDGLDVAQCW